MKSNTLLTIAVCFAMLCTPKVIAQSILTDKKDKDGNEANKPIELTIPKQYNKVLVVKKECNNKGKAVKLPEKKGNIKLYNAPICRGATYRSSLNMRKVQR